MTDTGSDYGRLLAKRDRLIADGVDPADLEMPLAPRKAMPPKTEPRTPRTKAGEHLFDVLRPHVTEGWLRDMGPGLALLVAKAEAEAARLALEGVAERVRALVDEAGGQCQKPDDFDPGELNVCVTHSELMDENGCEDQPRQLLAVLALFSTEGSGK